MPTSTENREQLALRIAEELVVARARVRDLEARFSQVFGGASLNGASLGTTKASTEGSAASRILAVFTRQPGKKIGMQDVVAELPDVDAGLVRSAIARFARIGKLKWVGRGVYKALPTTGEDES